MTQYYVRIDGNNANTGLSNTAGGAWLTISKANGIAGAGDTVNVNDGTYTGGFSTTSNGAAGNPLIFKSINLHGAKIVGGSPLWNNSGNYVTVDGFEVSGATGAFGLISGDFNNLTDLGHHYTCKNNYIHDMNVGSCGSGGAIDVFSITGVNIVTGNRIDNVGGASLIGSCSTQQGMYIQGPGNYVANNIVSNCAATACQTEHTGTSSVFFNNIFFHCDIGIYIGGTGPINCIIANNICINNLGYGMIAAAASSNNQYLNNCCFGNGVNIQVNAGDIQTNNIITSPLFVNYLDNGTGDYHLTSSSPCKDTGIASATTIPGGVLWNAPSVDFDGIARPQGGLFDMGAYEVVSGSSGGDGIAGSAKNWRRHSSRGFR